MNTIPTHRVLCEYFALCDNAAIGWIDSPVIGPVPCCQRCADKVGLTLRAPGTPRPEVQR